MCFYMAVSFNLYTEITIKKTFLLLKETNINLATVLITCELQRILLVMYHNTLIGTFN